MTDTQLKRGGYNCPNCGAAATPESVRCAYCHTGLATLVCSSCFGAIFIGMKHCPWCGALASAGRAVEQAPGKCPRCDTAFLLVKAGRETLRECPACGGLWVDNATLQRICTEQEEMQAVMGFNPDPVRTAVGKSHQPARVYIPCPECQKLMNRRQFAGCSGVIVDWCKAHGTWFDRDELKQIIQFILAGGLNKSREREKIKLEEEKQNLREQERNLRAISRLACEPSLPAASLGSDTDLLRVFGEIWRTLRE